MRWLDKATRLCATIGRAHAIQAKTGRARAGDPIPEANQLIDGIAAFNQAHEHCNFLSIAASAAHSTARPLTRGTWDGVILGRHLPGFLARRGTETTLRRGGRRSASIRRRAQVRPDNLAIGRKAADHLLRQGFPSYGFCGFSNEHWSLQRHTGFVSRLKQSGKTCQIIETAFPANGPSHWSLDEEVLTARVSRRLRRRHLLLQRLPRRHAARCLWPRRIDGADRRRDSGYKQ